MSNEETVPASNKISHHVIPTERAGAKSVWVQGDLSLAQKADGQVCFMTVHDVGVNHHSWLDFINHPSMRPIRERAVFVHVDLLGKSSHSITWNKLLFECICFLLGQNIFFLGQI